MSRYYNGFSEYVPVAEKKAQAAAALKKLSKNNPSTEPVIIKGSKIVATWWGTAWIQNLEKYADYSNRIGRGRSYVRNGAVLDLRIDEGVINALVQGSGSRPYRVSIRISPISKQSWKKIIAVCEGKLGSLSEFFTGKFPKSLAELFTSKKQGLFPSPSQITLDCSCPDWADMCKHVAAVLYGVGTRLDKDPSLFFKLRGVNVDDLISKAVAGESDKLAKKAGVSGRRVISDADLSLIFGINYDTKVFEKKKSSGKSSSPTRTEKKKNAVVK